MSRLNPTSKQLLFLLILLLSVAMFAFAPDVYSHVFCVFCFVAYLLMSVIFFACRPQKNVLNFDVIFFIAAFFVFFVYPVFIYPINPTHYHMFNLKFNHNVISQSTALALVAFSSYAFGTSLFIVDKNHFFKEPLKRELLPNKFFVGFTIILFIITFSQIKPEFFQEYIGMDVGVAAKYLLLLTDAFLFSALIIEFYNLSIKGIHKLKDVWIAFNKHLLLLVVVYLAVFLYAGVRGHLILLVMMCGCIYALIIKPIRWKQLTFLIILGALFLSAVGTSRFHKGRDVPTERVVYKSVFDPMMDLIINNRALYVSVDLVQKNGITYGKSMIGNFAAPVPFSQSVISKMFGIRPSEMTSSMIFTTMELGENSKVGLGTNVVADLYLGFGLFGVIFFMLFLGYFVRKSMLQASAGSLSYLICYAVLASYALALIRLEYFFPFRTLVWCLLTIAIIQKTRYSFYRNNC